MKTVMKAAKALFGILTITAALALQVQGQPLTTTYFSTANADTWQVSGGGATNATPYEATNWGGISITSTCDGDGTYVAGMTSFTGFWLADFVFYLPYNATNISLTYSNLGVDDRALLLLNGNPIVAAGIPSDGSYNPGSFVYTDGGLPQPYDSFVGPGGSSGTVTNGFNIGGANTLQVIVNNTGQGVVGPDVPLYIYGGDETWLRLSGAVSYSALVATASAVLTNGFVIGATIFDGGYGYTNTPTVRIIGGGGSGAEAVAVVSNGVVIAVNVLDAGYGYTNAPVIVIEPPFIEPPTMGIAAMSLLSFTNLVMGTNYQLQSFLGGTWFDMGAAFTAAGSTFMQYVSGAAAPNGYRLAVTPVPTQAYATAQLDNGFVVAAAVTNGGFGYSASPAVTISGGGGSGAEAVAVVSNEVVVAVNIMDAGYGYTNTPTIIIAPPQVAVLALWPMVTQTMELDLGQLAPYDNYQLEFTRVIGGVWSNLGLPFTPTSSTSTQYVTVSGNAGFFRARHVP